MRTFYLFTHEPLDNILIFSHEKLPKGTYGFIFEIRMGKKKLGDGRSRNWPNFPGIRHKRIRYNKIDDINFFFQILIQNFE